MADITIEITPPAPITVAIDKGIASTSLPYIDLGGDNRIAWDDESGTMTVAMPGGNVTLQVGQEQLAQVRNKTGSTIPNGALVYISGATGQLPEISLADADSYDQSVKTLAMATESIDNNAIGYVNTFGIVRDLNTNGIPEGTVLFLSQTAGGFTTTAPAWPANRVAIGVCIYENHTNGRVLFFPRFSFRKFGAVDDGNYTGFNDLGRLIGYGSARTYNDLPPIPLLNQRTGGANQPSLTAFQGNIYQLTFAVNAYVYGNYEILHEYAEGTNLEPHVHFATNGTDTTDRTVKYELEYSIANGHEAFQAATIISAETVIPANTPDRTHFIAFDFPAIVGTGLKIGAYITYRFRRIASTGTEPTGSPFALTLGFHVLQDTLGSGNVGTKGIS